MTLTPLMRQKVEELVKVQRYDDARKLLRKMPQSAEVKQYLMDIDTLETPMDRAAKKANKVFFYIALGFVGLMLLTALWIAFWTTINK